MLETAGAPALQVKAADCVMVRRDAAVSVVPDGAALSIMMIG